MPTTTERFVLVDVGCIECGEQTEVIGIYDSEDEAEVAYISAVEHLGITEDNAGPRGGWLELLGLHDKDKSTYLGGVGYFSGGQHALEMHVIPPRTLTEPTSP